MCTQARQDKLRQRNLFSENKAASLPATGSPAAASQANDRESGQGERAGKEPGRGAGRQAKQAAQAKQLAAEGVAPHKHGGAAAGPQRQHTGKHAARPDAAGQAATAASTQPSAQAQLQLQLPLQSASREDVARLQHVSQARPRPR